ncbi:MAG TPA: hypothetical protein VMU87_16320 [Stellaceae bacterium]|nr:hypothetical protein [Stellaceae bacterium]
MPNSIDEMTKSERERWGRDDRRRKDDDDGDDLDVAALAARIRKLAKSLDKLQPGDDAERDTIAAQIDALEKLVARIASGTPQEEREATDRLQARADTLHHIGGAAMPSPIAGERAASYRRRLLAHLQPKSPHWAALDLARADAAMLDLAEHCIFADAERAYRADAANSGELHEVVERDSVGRKITRYEGDISEFMRPFSRGGESVKLADPRRIPQ